MIRPHKYFSIKTLEKRRHGIELNEPPQKTSMLAKHHHILKATALHLTHLDTLKWVSV